MAQFDFYGTRDDSQELVAALAQTESFSYIVDRWYRSDEQLDLTRFENGLRDRIEKRTLIYLRSDRFSLFPPVLSPATPDGLSRIDILVSGPFLELALPAGHKADSGFRIGLGDLMYQPSYRHPVGGEWYKPAQALKDAYRRLVHLFKTLMVKRFVESQVVQKGDVRPIVATLWVGKDAAALLDRDLAEILVYGEWLPGRALRTEPPIDSE